MDDVKGKLEQLRDDVEAGHEHVGVSLLRLIDLMLYRVPDQEQEQGQGQEATPEPTTVVPVE